MINSIKHFLILWQTYFDYIFELLRFQWLTDHLSIELSLKVCHALVRLMISVICWLWRRLLFKLLCLFLFFILFFTKALLNRHKYYCILSSLLTEMQLGPARWKYSLWVVIFSIMDHRGKKPFWNLLVFKNMYRYKQVVGNKRWTFRTHSPAHRSTHGHVG